jgi:uncharacterized protein YbjT (DUF2867 family)
MSGEAAKRVLILGADGFIGRHLAYGLRAAGWQVILQARRGDRLAAMGFAVVSVDLADPACHVAGFWTPHLAPGTALVNAAGLLTGSDSAFAAVHRDAPAAALHALQGRAVLISAVGLDAETPFARWRCQTEQLFAGQTILRPGLVLADTSYGGSSLLRALAALPLRLPVVGRGDQPFNPIHAADLAAVVAACLDQPPGPGPAGGAWEVGGPEVLTQAALAQGLRRWLGLRPVPLWPLPLGLARALGHLGDALRIGPVSATAVAQLQTGVLADAAPLMERLPQVQPRGFSLFQAARPAGTQDLWQARLYLLKPAIRLALAAMWLVSAGLGLMLPASDFLSRLGTALPPEALVAMARAGGLADLALGLALLRNWAPLRVAQAQIALVLAYSLGLTVLAPDLWLDPFGGLLKNLPVLALLAVHLALVEER